MFSTLKRSGVALGAVLMAALGLIAGMIAPAAAQPSPTPERVRASFGDNPSGKLHAPPKPATSLRAATARTVAPTLACPPVLKALASQGIACVAKPAARQLLVPTDKTSYCNYDLAKRTPKSGQIDKHVIHIGEGGLQDIIDVVQTPTSCVSWHLTVHERTLYYHVPLDDIGWHCGNWPCNMRSVGYELVGHSVSARTEISSTTYRTLATTIRAVGKLYKIPEDREHIIGHHEVPGLTEKAIEGQHWDPGPYFDWRRLMQLVGMTDPWHQFSLNPTQVIVAPLRSQRVLQDCSVAPCKNLPRQPVNFVPLRTQPSETAPFLTDPVLGQGSTDVANRAARATYGQRYVVEQWRLDADLHGVWARVWYTSGITGWIHSTLSDPTLVPAAGSWVTPKTGKLSIPVYGGNYPRESAYPADFTARPAFAPVPYTMQAGDRAYLVGRCNEPGEYYYAWSIDGSLPYDQTWFTDTSVRYCTLQIAGAWYRVKASDVEIHDAQRGGLSSTQSSVRPELQGWLRHYQAARG